MKPGQPDAPLPPHLKLNPEGANLPTWLFPLGFWVGLAGLLAAIFWPALARYAVYWVMLVPVLAALSVVVVNWQRDRRLSAAALLALLGLGLVFFGRELLR